MANIDTFKANLLGGGARANQFRIYINPPPGITTGLEGKSDKISYLIKSSTGLPVSNIGEIAIPFRGRTIYFAGDRPAPDTWSTTFLNDTDFMIRTAMEKWSNGINDLKNATGVTNPSAYEVDLTVIQKDRDDKTLKTYIFKSAWPTSITSIPLTSESADAIEEFDVTWRYQHFEASGVNF